MMITIERNREKVEYNNLLFCYAVFLSNIAGLFNGIMRLMIGNTYRLDTMIVYGILLLLVLKALPYFSLKISLKEFVVIGIYMSMWLLSFAVGMSSSELFSEEITDITTSCLFVYIIAHVLTYSESLVKYLRLFAYIGILNVLASVFVFNQSDLVSQYSQYLGYELLAIFLILLVPIMIDRCMLDIVMLVVVALLTVSAGARGPLLYEVVGVVVAVIFYLDGRRRLIILIATIVVTIICAYNITNIALILSNIIGSIGGNSRVLDALINDSFFEDSARNSIMDYAVSYIEEHLFIGSGFLNDRVMIAATLGQSDPIGWYPHNIFLEILMQFGLFPGIMVIAFGSYLFIVAYKKHCGKSEKLLYLVLVMEALLPLMTSGSYLDWKWMYILVGYSFAILYRGTVHNTL